MRPYFDSPFHHLEVEVILVHLPLKAGGPYFCKSLYGFHARATLFVLFLPDLLLLVLCAMDIHVLSTAHILSSSFLFLYNLCQFWVHHVYLSIDEAASVATEINLGMRVRFSCTGEFLGLGLPKQQPPAPSTPGSPWQSTSKEGAVPEAVREI